MSREQSQKRKWLAELLFMHGEIIFNTRRYTVFLQENNSSGFDFSLFKLGTKPDINGEFDEDKLIDGGIIDEVCHLEAINYIFEA